jgi:hypothetical protein
MEYQGKFGPDVCEVHIEARATQNGDPVYVAVPYVLADHTLYWFKNKRGGQLEVFGADERDALDRASTYLRDNVGPQTEPLTAAPELKSPLLLMSMSKRKTRIDASSGTESSRARDGK